MDFKNNFTENISDSVIKTIAKFLTLGKFKITLGTFKISGTFCLRKGNSFGDKIILGHKSSSNKIYININDIFL